MRFFFYSFLFLSVSVHSLCAEIRLALWIPCESHNDTLSSKAKIDEMIRLSEANDVRVLFIQVYRRNHSWYPSELAIDQPYRTFKQKEGFSSLPYLIREAHTRNIEVHLWFNVLRIGKDKNVPILKKLGVDVVTRDNRNRSILDYDSFQIPPPEDKYFSYAADGIWLEAADPRVSQYLIDVIAEALAYMPEADGIHLDFIRYPFVSPSAPGSYYEGKGISFGYGKASVEGFRKKTGLNIFDMEHSKENALAWDTWRRTHISNLIRKVKKYLSNKNKVLSCAVLAWPERIYFNSFQNWPEWIEKDLVDFVVVMNYSFDRQMVRYLSKMALGVGGPSKIWIGLGAYLLEGRLENLQGQILDSLKAGAQNIVLFSYDSLIKDDKMQKIVNRSMSESNGYTKDS